MPSKNVSVDAVLLQGYQIEVKSRQHVTIVDQPPAGGGEDSGPTPLEFLLVSLASCFCTIGKIIAMQKRLPLRAIEVHVEGELDTDVLMGKRDDVRAGFSSIRVVTKIDADMNIVNQTPVEFVVE